MRAFSCARASSLRDLPSRLQPAPPGLSSFRLALLTGLFACLLALACFASSARAGDRIYWANQFAPNKISFANLDGSGGGDLSTTGAASGEPRGVAIDVAGGKVYWTNPVGDRISFANLDGSGGGGNLNTTGATVNQPNAAAVYPAAGRIYWTNEFGDRISFANLNNTRRRRPGHDRARR